MRHSKVLALSLCLLCLLSFFPVGSSAAEEVSFKPLAVDEHVSVNVQAVGNPIYSGKLNMGDYHVYLPLKDIQSVLYSWDTYYDFVAGDQWNVEFEFFNPEFSAFKISIVGVLADDNIVLWQQNHEQSSSSITASFSPPSSFTGQLAILFSNENCNYTYVGWVGLKSTKIEYKTVEDSVSDKISGFFSELGDSISNWFNQLKEWIKAIPDKISEFISEVGSWFSELGDKLGGWFESIGEWFSDLKQSISDWIDNIKNWFTNLFTIPDGFGDEYQEKWDSFLKAHFGFLYESIDLISNIIERIQTAFSEKEHVLVLPDIKLPWMDEPLLESQTFSFEGFLNKYSWANSLYNTYIIGVWGLFAFMLINLGYNKYKRIVGRS